MSKLEWMALFILLLVGLHFYSQYQLEHVDADTPLSLSSYMKDGKTPTIVAFGDDLTAGVGAPKGESYPDQLSRLMGIDIINAGRPGETSASARSRIKSVLQKYKPDIVLIAVGWRDLQTGRRRSELKKNLVTIVKTVKIEGALPLVIGFPDPDLIDLMISSDLDLFEEAARKGGGRYIPDVFGPVLKDEDLKSDETHPNAKGYQKAAETIREYFEEEMLL